MSSRAGRYLNKISSFAILANHNYKFECEKIQKIKLACSVDAVRITGHVILIGWYVAAEHKLKYLNAAKHTPGQQNSNSSAW